MEKEELEYTLKEIKRDPSRPYRMANEPLADEEYPYICKRIPGTQMIKCGIFQYFVTNEEAKKALLKRLAQLRKEALDELHELDKAIKEIE